MRQIFLMLIIVTMTTLNSVQARQFDLSKFETFKRDLDDVMEILDTTYLEEKLVEVERAHHENPDELNRARLGIIYHEVALNLSFFSKSKYNGYAQKSYDLLSDLEQSGRTTDELLPFISAYRASALALVSSETKKLRLLGEAFDLFDQAVTKYGAVCYAPEFLRGSVSENMPWFFFNKRNYVKRDFQSIIEKQEKDSAYADWKIMSFTYWAWARQHQSKRYRQQALEYLDRAIYLDPHYKAGRERAEKLKERLKR